VCVCVCFKTIECAVLFIVDVLKMLHCQ
jgi:hypothetical protein